MTPPTPPAMPRRKSRLPLAAVLVVAAAAWLAVRKTDRDPAKPVVLADIVAPGAAAGFNVLLITLDTTRPDRLGCYGYALAHTPTIDGLAARGVRFDDAVTSVPLTLPSHATILTGRYPPRTGVRVNGVHRLGEEHTTLAERLKAEGYETAAFVASFVLDRKFGLDQGFDTYDFRVGVDGQIGHGVRVSERRASEVSTAAIEWLDGRAKRGPTAPFFMWIHYYDPHEPYDSPLAETQSYSGRPYDAEIGFVDLHLRRLLDAVSRHGLLEKTLVVVVTDHGEGLYEHEEALHGIFLYETTLHAGLILSSPVLFDRAYRVDDRVVGTIDVVPTILDLLGNPPADDGDGHSLLTARHDPDRAIYIETLFPADNACRPLFGLRRHGDKYIDAPRPEYYNIKSDPSEERNLYGATSPDAQGLARRLSAVRETWSDAESTPLQPMSPEDRARLESLGYLGGGATAAVDELPDCKDQISIVNRMTEVTRLKKEERYAEGIALAIEVMNESKGWYAPVNNLADMYEKTNRNAEAERLLAEFTRQHPSPEALLHLAQVQFYGLRRAEACLDTLQAALLLDEKFGAVYVVRGDVYTEQGRFEEALQEYRKALEVDPEQSGVEASDRLRKLAEKRAGVNP